MVTEHASAEGSHMQVYIEDIIEAMDWSGESFLNSETGAVLTFTDADEYAYSKCEELPEGATDEEIYDILGWEDPEFANFLRNEESYIRLPDQFDIHEYRMMKHFIMTVDDEEQRDALWEAIHRKKAYRRFKDTVHYFGIQNLWYDFKEQRLLEIAQRWCSEHDLAYVYRRPEKVLARRTLDGAASEDAPVKAGDEIFYGGYFGFNYTSLLADIKSNDYELEEVELDVDLWLSWHKDSPAEAPEGYELPEMPLLLELSPDRRLVTPDDDHALYLCCTLIDAPLWLQAAKRDGKKTLKALLVPMEVHADHICKHKESYVEYWNGKIDDLLQDIKHRSLQPAKSGVLGA